MAKKQLEGMGQEIRKIAETGKAVFGTKQTMTLAKKGKIATVYLASNCESAAKADAVHVGKLAGIPIKETEYNNDELGIICKRHHSVSVLGVKNG